MTDAQALLAARADVAFGTPGAWVHVAALDRASLELVGDCAVYVLADGGGIAEVGVRRAPDRQGLRRARCVYAMLEHVWPAARD